jgi:hypothetical protein
LISWQTPPPPPVEVAATPILGTRAPTSSKLRLPIGDGRSTIVIFLRHCGCPCKLFTACHAKQEVLIPLSPVAEKTFLEARRLANKYPSINFIAISHSSKAATDKWVSQVGGAWAVNILIDDEREIYASWGLGVSTTYYLLNPWTQIAARKLGKEEGLWGREVDPSGNRWQVGGSWATDESKWFSELFYFLNGEMEWTSDFKLESSDVCLDFEHSTPFNVLLDLNIKLTFRSGNSTMGSCKQDCG